MKKSKKKNRKGLIVLIAIIVFFALVLGSGDSDSAPTGNNNTTEATVENKIVYEDSSMKIEYKTIEKRFDIEGCLYLTLKINNTTDKLVIVALEDVSVNGNSMQTGTGLPIKIHPGESSSQPFIIFQSGTDIDEAEDVETIKFRVVFFDENYNEYKSSERITVEL